MSLITTTGSLWAPVCISGRVEWVMWVYIRTTRREAKRAYLEGFNPDQQRDALRRVRFAKVSIAHDTKEAR